jgi:hypothetical protein
MNSEDEQRPCASNGNFLLKFYCALRYSLTKYEVSKTRIGLVFPLPIYFIPVRINLSSGASIMSSQTSTFGQAQKSGFSLYEFIAALFAVELREKLDARNDGAYFWGL